MIAHVFLCVLCELRESLLLILSAFGRGTPPIHYGGLGEQGARATRFCPRMTASVRIWPQEFAKTTSALGGQERFLSAVGQRAVLVRRQRGRRPGAPRLAIPASSARDMGHRKRCRPRPGPGLRLRY